MPRGRSEPRRLRRADARASAATTRERRVQQFELRGADVSGFASGWSSSKDREIAEGTNEDIVGRAADEIPAWRDARPAASRADGRRRGRHGRQTPARGPSARAADRAPASSRDDQESDRERDVEADALLRVRGRRQSRCRRRRSASGATPRTARAEAPRRADRATTGGSATCGWHATRIRSPARTPPPRPSATSFSHEWQV